MDEGHNARSDQRRVSGTIAGSVLQLGFVDFDTPDCELWRIGTKILTDYHQVRNSSPPAGELRLKRWSGVVVGTPHTFYDYVAVPTDFQSDNEYDTIVRRERALFHEFGHSIRHVADGSEAHWNGDNFRWAYGRSHNDPNAIYNEQYTFNEGWADYWRQARLLNGDKDTQSSRAVGFRDWNEHLVANRLLELAKLSPGHDSTMVDVLISNPGTIHTLYEFERRLYDFIKVRFPTIPEPFPRPPAPAACPPDYTNDGATCRRDVSVVAKPSYPRGAGAAPTGCGPGQEYDAGLCYPACPAGFHGVGPVCWGTCPAGYDDHGATCFRNARIISADNSKCPWYDKCGLTLSKGCSTCPAGYANDGCTCRIDVSTLAKPSTTRGAGTVPTVCLAGKQLDAGLCYTPCNAGFSPKGPVCWGGCPAEYDDHGATCYRGASVFVRY